MMYVRTCRGVVKARAAEPGLPVSHVVQVILWIPEDPEIVVRAPSVICEQYSVRPNTFC